MDFKKILKSRLFMGIVCIILAILFIFAGIRTQERNNAVKDVVVVSEYIKKGEVITDDKLSIKSVGAKNTDEFIGDRTIVAGKYALADLMAGDLVTENKIAETLPSVEGKLLSLDGSRVAISISLKDFAAGVSDKVVSGDIVSCIVTSETGTMIPPELTYMEVLATTAPSGIDKQYADEVEEENLATVTLLATPPQAMLLAQFNTLAEIHLVLVYRGDVKNADAFLSMQNEILKAKSEPEKPADAAGTEVDKKEVTANE